MADPDDRQILATGQFLQLIREGRWEFTERIGVTGVVAVLAMTSDDALVLTEQYRPPVGKRVIDLPAGLAGDICGQEAEDFSAAALRELEEETGFTAKSMRPLATLPTSPGLTSETIDLYLAESVTQIGAGGGDEHEEITVHVVGRRDIAAWLDERAAQGCLIDSKVYAALWWSDQLLNSE